MTDKKRGGARPGAGRPESKNKKIQYQTRLAPDLIEYLRASDQPAAQIIDAALREYKNKSKINEKSIDINLN